MKSKLENFFYGSDDVKIVLFKSSENVKTGDIPQTYSSPNSCPVRCPFKNKGCYAECGPANWAWQKVVNGVNADEISGILNRYVTKKKLRHNIAGDIAKPGTSDISEALLNTLNKAFKRHNAYTYTHCEINDRNVELVKKSKMVISFSCETISQVKKCHVANVPAVMAVHSMSKPKLKIDGITFRQCPATQKDADFITTCEMCNLCMNRKRKEVIVFPVHGKTANKATFLLDI